MTTKQELAVQEFLKQYHEFVTSDIRNTWICVTNFKMYVRKSMRCYNNNAINCLDIASMEADICGTKMFTKILTMLLLTYPDKHFFVESILNPRLPVLPTTRVPDANIDFISSMDLSVSPDTSKPCSARIVSIITKTA